MNAYRIALFILMVQGSIVIAGFANIPVSCSNADCSVFVPFNENLIGSSTIFDIIAGEFDEGQYRTTRIQANVFDTGIFTGTATAIEKAVSIVSFSATGGFNLVRFFFGVSELTFWIGIIVQSTIYFFLVKAAIDMIRSGGEGRI